MIVRAKLMRSVPNRKKLEITLPAYHPFGNSYRGVDSWDLADEVYNRVRSTEIQAAAINLKNALDNFVTNELHSLDMVGSHGIVLSISTNLDRI
jgi:hypothetical protein